MKQPKPWFWKARGAWYVQVHGKQIKLHENEKEANKIYHRLMADQGSHAAKGPRCLTVAGAVDILCESVNHLRERTITAYVGQLGPIAGKFRDQALDSITPTEIINFIGSYQGRGYKNKKFNDGTRHLMLRYVKLLFRWARDTGYIQVNPFTKTASPWLSKARTRGMTQEEYDAIMGDARTNPKVKEVIEFLWKTGARLGEIIKIEARHLDAILPIARLQPTEHKTGTKTGLQREIVMPGDLMDRLRDYAKATPRGPLIRGVKGRPFTQISMSCRFRKIRIRLGLADDLVLHMARHAFITRMIKGGVSDALVAKMCGHGDTKIIQRVYYHPDMDEMVKMVDKLGRPTDTP